MKISTKGRYGLRVMIDLAPTVWTNTFRCVKFLNDKILRLNIRNKS